MGNKRLSVARAIGFFVAASLPSSLLASETITYTYDARGQVVGVDRSGTVNNGQSVDITYDKAGNRTNYTATGASTTADLSIGNATATEGGDLVFTVTRSGVTSIAASASYATADVTALAGSDYTAASGTVSFASGETSKTITVATTDDAAIESAETMTVTLSGASGGAAIASATGTGTITDNDTPPSISVSDATATEGSNLSFTVTLSAVSGNTVTVAYASADGTANAGTDYTAASGTLSFAPGEISKTVAVTTTTDSYVESAESMSLGLSSPTNATIADGSGAGTINDDGDPDVTFSISDASITEGGNLTFLVTKSGLTLSTVSVSYATSNGTATAGSDYTATSGTLSFNLLEYIKTITVPTTDDTVQEALETLNLTLSSPTGGAGLTDYVGVGSITDNDSPTLAIADASTTEGGTLSFTVTRGGDSSSAVSVSYATSNGTATAGSDYTATSGTLSFASGETTKTISVSTTDDAASESAETLTVTLSSPVGATLADATATGTIADNDTPAQFAIGNASVAEGGTLSFTVTRSNNTAIAASVNYATANGTATAGSDYTAASGTLSFAAGETSKAVTVTTTNDSTTESDETLTVTLSSPSSGATITTATGTGTILDNDGALLAIGAASATEGGALTFTVTRSNVTTTAVTVNYATSGTTATSGTDFTATSGTLSFAAGQTSKTITVSTINDTEIEDAETLKVTLSSPSSGATITTAVGVGTINDNDTGLSINNRTVTEGTAFTFTVTRAGVTTGSTSVNYATSNVTATAGSDYTATSGTLTFAAGETTKTITVNTINDSLAEADETLNVTLSSPTGGAVLTDALGVGTIESDELGFLISDESHNESGSFTFTVTKVGTATGTTTVNYATSNGTATAGSDYTAKSGTLSFAASITSKTFTVSITSDTVAESDETVIVTLSSPSAGTLIDATGVGTILDND
ncbi:MAG: Calx-beta domain-containing protein [Candidatus Andeanibacterium colombiense]|uniref:Calx-beta domain-containing protein n=1 Tax=Candidatus Andeanibacterium colombiense TaxID=3121345 RepID=A0AAJ5X6B0_9SPHN|nr:MAG: Calx-beta domain-containing protein [Sphingomonadaceae bacterium]